MSNCPFCGGSVEIDDPEAHKHGIGFRIECEACYVSMNAFAGETPDSLIARWNNRKPAQSNAGAELQAAVETNRQHWK